MAHRKGAFKAGKPEIKQDADDAPQHRGSVNLFMLGY